MERLTDRKEAEKVRQNMEKLIAAGVEPSRIDREYVKLAQYENAEEDRERASCSYDPDEWYE